MNKVCVCVTATKNVQLWILLMVGDAQKCTGHVSVEARKGVRGCVEVRIDWLARQSCQESTVGHFLSPQNHNPFYR